MHILLKQKHFVISIKHGMKLIAQDIPGEFNLTFNQSFSNYIYYGYANTT